MAVTFDDLLKPKPQGATFEALLGDSAPSPAPTHTPIQEEDTGLTGYLTSTGKAIMQPLIAPAATALEVISYLDKPRGALAGTVKAYQDDTPLLEGAKKGWDENTSWKETFNHEWVKENPTTAAIAGFAADVVADPLLIATPAKAVRMAAKGSKAIGLTDYVAPAVNAIKQSERGQKVAATFEDLLGVRRIDKTGVLDDFNMNRAADDVIRQDFTDPLGKLKKEFPDQADKATDYIEALPREAAIGNTAFDVVTATKDGSIFKAIKDGQISRTEAFDALRNAGEEIPDQLLQTHQRQAKIAGETIPDYVYRDQILSAVPDEKARKAIQTIGDLVIDKNKQFSDQIYDIGRIGDAEYVEFIGGSHLRRSYEQFESAEDFLKGVRKNGTPEEWQKAYTAFQENKTGVGPSAKHKIDQRDFMKRQTLSDETMKKMGIITDTEYRVADTFNRASKTLREDEFLTKIDGLFGKSEQEAAALSRGLPKRREYIPIPDSKAYGALAGKWVPRDIANEVLKLTGTGAQPSDLVKSLQKAVSWFKVAKLSAPAPIMRNLYSGLPMANAFGKVPMQAIPLDMARVLSAYSKGGKNNAFIREFRASGALEGEWVGNELKNILGGKPTGIKRMADIGMQAFGTPDKFWRAVVYSYHRRQGKSVAEAGKIARKALLDYSAAPDWINTISKNGIVPFAKFPFMASKETAKALYNNPTQVTKFVKPQNQVNTDDREKIMPDYQKSRTLLPVGSGTRIVNGKEQKVQRNIDLSYILPFASDVNFGNPVIDAAMLYRTGRNGLGQEVIKPGMTDKEKAGVWTKHLWNAAGPSIPLPGNYAGDKLVDGWQGNVDSKGRQYDLKDAVAQTLLGIKNTPINTAEQFKQKMTTMQMQQRNIQIIMSQIGKDQSISKEQKKERIKEHVGQLKELGKTMKETQEAYAREKKRGAI
jgi:hypothetical protein